MAESVLASGGQYLQDGFQEIFSFRGHKLQVRGIDTVEIGDHNSNSHGTRRHDQFLSWDVKAILLWEHSCDGESPRVVSRYNFPKNQPNYISAVVFIPKMKVFLAAALDMTFKIFDKHFKLLQEFHHDERAILSLQYDPERAIVICSGASGITVWRCYRNLSLDNCHVVEKMFTFDGCNHWVSSMIYESQSGKLYALVDRSVHVLSFAKRSVVTVLKDVHESPVTTVCWYARSQFYLTGCSQGLIKCWTSHFRDVNKLQNMGTAKEQINEDEDDLRSVRYALLHTFQCHTKAISGLILHSTSGLAISSSLDGFVKVLNLEAFSELFCVDTGQGITGLRGLRYGMHMACLFSQLNGRIRLWKVTSCCNFFGISAANIETVDCFDNLQINDAAAPTTDALSSTKTVDQSSTKSAASGDDPTLTRAASHGSLMDDSHDNELDNEEDDGEYGGGLMMYDAEGGSEMDGYDETNELEHTHHALQIINHHNQRHHLSQQNQGQTNTHSHHGRHTRLVASYAAQDLRVYNQHGGLVCRVEPTEVVDGIQCYTVSVSQELLFCLLHSGKVKVYCCRNLHSPLVKEINILGNGEEEQGTGLCLIDVVPQLPASLLGHMHGYGHHHQHGAKKENSRQSLRGEPSPLDISGTEILVLAQASGALLFLDTYSDLEVTSMFQASLGPVANLHYRRSRKELLAVCTSTLHNTVTVRCWHLPTLATVCASPPVPELSCYDISQTLPFFGVGCKDGFVRLFRVDQVVISSSLQTQAQSNVDVCIEIERLCLVHEGAVVSISFCDTLQLYATSAMDSTLKIWDFEKRLIRSIKFNLPPSSIRFHGRVGDIVISQRNYLLQTTMQIWNEGNYLQTVQETDDPWATHQVEGGLGEEAGLEMAQIQAIIRNAEKTAAAAVASTKSSGPDVTSGVAGMENDTAVNATGKATEHKSVEFSESVSVMMESNSVAAPIRGPHANAAADTPLEVHRPRFYFETKPPVIYKIPEIDDVLEDELRKEDMLVEKLRQERELRDMPKPTSFSKPSRHKSNPAAMMSSKGVSVTAAIVQSEEEADLIQNRSLYVARKVASLGLSPRARMVLLKREKEVDSEELASHLSSSPEALAAAIESSLKGARHSPQPPLAAASGSGKLDTAAPASLSAGRASIRGSLLSYSAGRATIMVARQVFDSVDTSTATSFETIESTSIVPIPGEVLLSSQYRSERQSFIARRARLRHPEAAVQESETNHTQFKRRQQDGPTAEATEKAVAIMRQKAEEARRLQQEEEALMMKQRQEKQQQLADSQRSALAKLNISSDHTVQSSHRESGVAHGRRKSGVGRSTHISLDEQTAETIHNIATSDESTVHGVVGSLKGNIRNTFTSAATMSPAIGLPSSRLTQVSRAGLQSVVENLEVELQSELPIIDGQHRPPPQGLLRRPSKRDSFRDPAPTPTGANRRESGREPKRESADPRRESARPLGERVREAAKLNAEAEAEALSNIGSGLAPQQQVDSVEDSTKDWIGDSFARASMIVSSAKPAAVVQPFQPKQQKSQRKTEFQSDPRMRSTFRVHGGDNG